MGGLGGAGESAGGATDNATPYRQRRRRGTHAPGATRIPAAAGRKVFFYEKLLRAVRRRQASTSAAVTAPLRSRS